MKRIGRQPAPWTPWQDARWPDSPIEPARKVTRRPFVAALRVGALTASIAFGAFVVLALSVATSAWDGVFLEVIVPILIVFGPAAVAFAITLRSARRRRRNEVDAAFDMDHRGAQKPRRRKHYYRLRHIAAALFKQPPPPKHSRQYPPRY